MDLTSVCLVAGSASRLGPEEDPCMCSILSFSSGISFRDSVFRAVLVCLVPFCNRLMLYYEEYVVLLRCSCVRLVKPLALFRGMLFGYRGRGF